MNIYVRRTVVVESVPVIQAVHVHLFDLNGLGPPGLAMLLQRADNGQWGCINSAISPGESPRDTAFRRVNEMIGHCPQFLIDAQRKLRVDLGQCYASISVFAAATWGSQVPVLNHESRRYRFDIPNEAIDQIDSEEQRISYRWALHAMRAFEKAMHRVVPGPPATILSSPRYLLPVFRETARILG
jgi:hypothetical protein